MQSQYPDTIRRLQSGEMQRKKTPPALKTFPHWASTGLATTQDTQGKGHAPQDTNTRHGHQW
jgi:hypothetical protein